MKTKDSKYREKQLKKMLENAEIQELKIRGELDLIIKKKERKLGKIQEKQRVLKDKLMDIWNEEYCTIEDIRNSEIFKNSPLTKEEKEEIRREVLEECGMLNV